MSEAGEPLRPGMRRDELDVLFREAAETAAAHIGGIAEAPVFRPMAEGDRSALSDMQWPGDGIEVAALLDFAREHILAHPFGNGHPRFLAWANSPPAPAGVAAEMLAAAMNPSCAGGDHAAIYLEHAVTRWLLDMAGMDDPGAIGLLVSGGSMANLTGLATARHAAAVRDGVDIREDGVHGLPRFVAYASDQIHSSVEKAMELMGLGRSALRRLPADDSYRLDMAGLRHAIASDREAGHRPFCVIASAGTVNTGAIDDLAGIAELCREEGLWMHVDGSIGVASALDERLTGELEGLSLADSIAFDPHKCLSVPVECGAVLVRDGEMLRDAFSLVPPYLRTTPGVGIGGPPWFSEYGFQQTRGFRAMKLWATLAHMGRSGAAALIRHQNDLGQALATRVSQEPRMELMAPVQLAIVCFRYVPEGDEHGGNAVDALNRGIVDRLQSEGLVFVTGTELRGRYVIRAATLHYATTEADLDLLIQEVVRLGDGDAEAS